MPICTREHCTTIASWSYLHEGQQHVCDAHFIHVQQHLTALGKIGPLHPNPVVFHRIWQRVEDPTANDRIQEMERQLSQYLGLPALLEEARINLRHAEGQHGVDVAQLEEANRVNAQLRDEIDTLRKALDNATRTDLGLQPQ